MEKNHYLMLLLLVICLAKLQTGGAEPQRLLFVGNSLTYVNDLPLLVEQVAGNRGIELVTTQLAKPNYAIVDHWADGQVQNLISTGNYDYVIIQQGPSSQSDGHHMLVNDGRLYRDLTHAHGAQLAYYMVWPSLLYYHTFPGVIANYTAGAEANDAILCPVGEVWKAHFDATGDFSYYDSDGFHPSLTGSRVAAEVIVDSLFGEESAEQSFQQAWITGVGHIEENQIIVPQLHITRHGAFGNDHEPADVARVPWGQATITFHSCHETTMSYVSNRAVNGMAFGSGSQPMQRLVMNQAGQLCDDLSFPQLTDKAFFSGTFFGGAERDGEGVHIDYLNSEQVIVTWYTYLPARR